MSEHEQVTGMLSREERGSARTRSRPCRFDHCGYAALFHRAVFSLHGSFRKNVSGCLRGISETRTGNVIPSIRRLLDHFRKNGSLVVFTAVGTETRTAAIWRAGQER